MTESEQTLTDRVVNIHIKRLVFGMVFLAAFIGMTFLMIEYEIVTKILVVMIGAFGVMVASYLIGVWIEGGQ